MSFSCAPFTSATRAATAALILEHAVQRHELRYDDLSHLGPLLCQECLTLRRRVRAKLIDAPAPRTGARSTVQPTTNRQRVERSASTLQVRRQTRKRRRV